jgi:hypothetical protein
MSQNVPPKKRRRPLGASAFSPLDESSENLLPDRFFCKIFRAVAEGRLQGGNRTSLPRRDSGGVARAICLSNRVRNSRRFPAILGFAGIAVAR